MADAYLLVKAIHILSATILFGTGLGTAFHFWYAYQSRDAGTIAAAARSTVIADFAFTLPAAIVQPVTGLLLARTAGYSLDTPWLAWAMVLYVIAGACWIPVVFIQLRLRDLSLEHVREASPPGARIQRLYNAWFALGWPAFIAMVATIWLMVSKPS